MNAVQRRSGRLINVLIVLGIVLSGMLVAGLAPTGTSEVRGAGAQAVSPALATDHAQSDATKDNKRKDPNRTDEAGTASASDDPNPQHAKQTQHDEQNPPGKAKEPQDRKPGRAGNWQDRCTGPALEQLPDSNLCTHGPDKPPPGFNPNKRVKPLAAHAAAGTAAGTAGTAAAITCAGDGESGFRVQVLYVRGSSVPSRFTEYRSSFQGWVAEMDQIFQESASETGGARSLRFVHDGGCYPVVLEVVIPDASVSTFRAMITELKNQGFNRTDRIYLSFVDTTSAGICGIGTLWKDDRADGNVNYNNVGPSYARADAGCWDGWVAAHEVMHNLGGVQLSAPNTSGGYHCIDEYDVMCYSDARGGSPKMRIDCSSTDLDETRFDCNDDDYYNVNPAAGSYLASRWNPANNRFLISAGETTGDTTPPSVSLAFVNKVKVGTSLAVKARASDTIGVTSVVFGVCQGTTCTWESARKLKTDTAAPFNVSWKAPRRGTFTFLAQATDDAGNATTSAPKTVRVVRR